jgi:hypothetical protein
VTVPGEVCLYHSEIALAPTGAVKVWAMLELRLVLEVFPTRAQEVLLWQSRLTTPVAVHPNRGLCKARYLA